VLVGCGLAGLIVSYLPNIVGVIGGAFAFSVGLVIFLHDRFTQSKRGYEEQVAKISRTQDPQYASHNDLSRILASVGDCLWSSRINQDGRFEYDYMSPEFAELTGYPPDMGQVSL
jgi:hypothetical protein